MDKFWQVDFGRSPAASIYAEASLLFSLMAQQAASGSDIFKFRLQILQSPDSFLQPLIFSSN
jgi:hypothetical protein